MDESNFLGVDKVAIGSAVAPAPHKKKQERKNNKRKSAQLKVIAALVPARDQFIKIIDAEITKQRDVFSAMTEDVLRGKSPDDIKIELLAGKRYITRLEQLKGLVTHVVDEEREVDDGE